jgi:nitrogenase molybdenum-iron protein alpha/beta subunit
MKNQYLREAGLQESLTNQVVTSINKAIDSVDDSILPEDLGKAIAIIVKDGYQDELRKRFMDALQAELNMESLNEAEKSLGEEFSIKFDVPASSDIDSITIRTKDIIEDETAKKMVDWIESKGYIVDRKRSNFDYDYEPGERDFWPRIRFNKK